MSRGRPTRSLTRGLTTAVTESIIAAFGPAERRCPQCWQWRPMRMFLSEHGGVVGRCSRCQKKYGRWDSLSLRKRASIAGSKHPPTTLTCHISYAPISENKKTGPIPVSMSEPGTCPPSCALYDTGCYALYGKMSAVWRMIGKRGISWDAFLVSIAKLPEGQLWRHNQAGDLAGQGDAIDGDALDALTLANAGKRGFTFTHKPMLSTTMLTPFRSKQAKAAPKHSPQLVARNREHVRRANAGGFTVNLSADSIEHADALAALKIAPVVVVVPEDAPHRIETPAGNLVIVCPAQTGSLTCATCGLCAKSHRKAIVGFRAHGQFRSLVSELVRSKR